MNKDLEKLYALVNSNLKLQCPILSGNTSSNIKVKNVFGDEIVIEISAKYYDLNNFFGEGKIVFTNENRNGKTDYVNDVNNYGGFFSDNESKHWINRAVITAVNTIANEMGAIVINKLGG